MLRKSAIVSLAVALAFATPAVAADYAGTYHGDIKGQPSSVELTSGGGSYTGTIHLGTTPLPCRATEQGDHLAGTFTSGGAWFDFTATLSADTLTLSTAGATYTLTRPPANPLDATGVPPPPAADAQVDGLQLASTDTGRAVIIHQPTATTAAAALDATLPLLPRAIGGPVSVTGRFGDTKQPDRGGASFTATVNGRRLHGVAFAGKSNPNGEDVAVAYCAADAPAAEWATLTAALPHPAQLRDFDFPDGSGSIGVPPGWTCRSSSAADAVVVDGPDGQRVTIGQTIALNGPQSPLVQSKRGAEEQKRQTDLSRQRLDMQMRAMGLQPAPMPPMPAMPPQPPDAAMGIFYGQFDDPLAMLRRVYPQLSEGSEANHGPPEHIDQILAVTPAQPMVQGGRADLVSMLWTAGTGATAEHFRFQGRLESSPTGYDTALLFCSGLRAHPDRFDRDLPTLWAVIQSFKPNNERIAQIGQQNNQQILALGKQLRDNQQAMFDRGQALHNQQAESFDRFESTINAQSTASHRAASDAAEMYSGYQDIVNTRTGERTSVDYYNSDGIVGALNDHAHDPTEWTAVHRRDEQYPLNR